MGMNVSAPRERMLRLLSLLQSGRRWPAQDLARVLEVPARTLRRDLEQLREMGYPVESARGPGGHYRLVAGSSLPPLMLDDEEAIATVLGLRLAAAGGMGVAFAHQAEQAGEKLRRILPASLRRRTDEVITAVEFAPTDHPQTEVAVLSAITHAISSHRCLSFGYRGKTEEADRSVEPMRLVQVRGRWYLFAWDRGRGDWRTFRIDRITDPTTMPDRFLPRPLPADDLAEYLRERFRGPKNHRVVLTLRTDARNAATRLHRIDGSLEAVDDHNCRYTAYVDSFEWLTTVLTVTDLEFSVEDPDEFRVFLRRTGERLLRAS